MMRQDIQVNELRRQKQALEESLMSLKQSNHSHNNKLTVLRQEYQQKLQTLTQQVPIGQSYAAKQKWLNMNCAGDVYSTADAAHASRSFGGATRQLEP